MGKINAGCVVVTKFCKPGEKQFTGYINYIDRDEAVRNEATAEYNLYQEYMGNPQKTTGLFVKDKDNLTSEEKKELKNIFKEAQKNESLMWQTVISFDNRWLENNGLYDSKTKILDEQRLHSITKSAITKMLHNESLDNAVWSAAMHLNTGNVHIHIAITEPIPMREQKKYTQYDEVIKDGKKYEFPILDKQGNPVKKIEYKGRFKQSSIEICKREVVNQIINEKENNLKINKIIRESIVRQKQSFAEDKKMQKAFEELYRNMPKCKKNMWNYNNSIMTKVRPMIDRLSDMYINEYHAEDFEMLKGSLENQEIVYQESYGNSGKSYTKGKMQDLYARLGNAILKEIREYDTNIKKLEEKHIDITEMELGVIRDPLPEDEEKSLGVIRDPLPEDEEKSLGVIRDLLPEDEEEPEEYLEQKLEEKGIHCRWSKIYKTAKALIYEEEKDYVTAKELLEDEHFVGNVLATYDLGDMYKYGRGCEINSEIAQQYYNVALNHFEYLYENQETTQQREKHYKQGKKRKEKDEYDIRSYYAYRIGKQYYYGQGTEENYEKARNWFETSGTKYAKYNLGKMAYYGQGEEKNFDKAFDYFIRLSKQESEQDKKDFYAYACYKSASMIENNEVEYNGEDYGTLYERALNAFLGMKQDDNLQYRIGMMYLQGKGTNVDEKLGEEYLEKSAEAGNVFSKYQLSQIYLERDNQEEVLKAVEYLTGAATKGENVTAMYSLGNVYSSDREYIHDIDKAFYWYEKAEECGNEFASYQLGRLYLQEENISKAIEYFNKCENKFAYYSLGKIYMDQELDNGQFYDINKSIDCFVKADEEGLEYATYQLGNIYADDKYGMKDMEKAVFWYEKAEKQENELASYKLGKIFLEQGKNKEAVEKFDKCTDNSYALYFKGKLYLDKESGIFDFNKGISSMLASAQMNNSYAQMYIGIMYIKGELIKRDIDKAKNWLERAEENGNDIAGEIRLNLDNNRYIRHRKQFAIGKNFILGMAARSIRDMTRKEMEKQRLAREYEKTQTQNIKKNNEEID